jgi:hypothetical protein
MQIAFATVAIFWWIAIWGLSDIFTEEWTRERKVQLYVSMIVGVLIIIWMFPNIVHKI